MTHPAPVRMVTTRPLRDGELKVLPVVITNVVESRQGTPPVTMSVTHLADFREWFPSLTGNRVRDLLGSIAEVQWSLDADSLREPMPIFWRVLEKGPAFIVEIDRRFLEQRASERIDQSHQLPDLIGQTEAHATDVARALGLSVRIDTRDGIPLSPFQTGEIRRDRATLKIEGGIVVKAFLG